MFFESTFLASFLSNFSIRNCTNNIHNISLIYRWSNIDKTGSELDKEELEYMLKFSETINYLNSSKELYSHSMLLLKRLYPIFLVRIIIELKTKKILKITEAPDSIKKLYKEIANIVIVSSMPNY